MAFSDITIGTAGQLTESGTTPVSALLFEV
jgi:hypothetical protein